MKLLLDTHILLWAASDPQRISDETQALLLDPANKLFFSVVSLWEVVIKRGFGRDDFSVDPQRLRRLLLVSRLSRNWTIRLLDLSVYQLPLYC